MSDKESLFKFQSETLAKIHGAYHFLSVAALFVLLYCMASENDPNNWLIVLLGGQENLTTVYTVTIIICFADLLLVPLFNLLTRKDGDPR